MAEYDNKGTGTFSDNNNRTEDWHPELRGKGIWLDGTEFWIDIKQRQSRDGHPFYSFKMRLKDGSTQKVKVQPATSNQSLSQELDDDVPF